MVFSQTSHKTHSILKVVEIDRLKCGKNQQVNCPTGVIADQSAESTAPATMATTSFTEEFIKPEPEFKSEMFHDSDCEFFQDLVQWCAAPAELEVAQSIDHPKITEARALNNDTLHTQFSPQGWEVGDANSPSAQAFTYNQPPSYPVSPTVESINFDMDYLDTQYTPNANKVPFQEQFLDISNLPVVIGDLASENTDINPWQPTEPIWQNTYNMDYDKALTHTNTLPFIDQEDSLDMKLISVTPRDVENNDVVISEYIIDSVIDSGGVQGRADNIVDRRVGALSIDVNTRTQPWPCDVISTPEVLSFVEQLEKEKCPIPNSITPPVQEDVILESSKIEHSPLVDYEPITPKTEPHIDSEEDTKSKRKRRHHDSEDSDETYTPYTEHTPRKYRRRKPSIPIKDMIRELEGSQQLTKARRGRPPKRRESTVSTISENSSTLSTHEYKYRELRDKNNEASKRSRMNRKLKELQMEQLATELEERNKKLRVRAELLEDMTKKLRDAFMAAVSQQKGS